MPVVRNEFGFRRSSEVFAGSSGVDISSYDRVGRWTTDAQVDVCRPNEQPRFVFASGCTGANAPVHVLWRASGGPLGLKLSGSGSAGAKLRGGTGGLIVASSTSESAVPGANDFGVALENFVDGDIVECDIFGGHN